MNSSYIAIGIFVMGIGFGGGYMLDDYIDNCEVNFKNRSAAGLTFGLCDDLKVMYTVLLITGVIGFFVMLFGFAAKKSSKKKKGGFAMDAFLSG